MNGTASHPGSLSEGAAEAKLRLRECTPLNGKMSNSLSFVGAMKIARKAPVSGRHVEWYSRSPAPSLRELAARKG